MHALHRDSDRALGHLPGVPESDPLLSPFERQMREQSARQMVAAKSDYSFLEGALASLWEDFMSNDAFRTMFESELEMAAGDEQWALQVDRTQGKVSSALAGALDLKPVGEMTVDQRKSNLISPERRGAIMMKVLERSPQFAGLFKGSIDAKIAEMREAKVQEVVSDQLKREYALAHGLRFDDVD